MKFIVDLWLDGYDSEEEMKQACLEFIRESLDCSASCVSVEFYTPPNKACRRLETGAANADSESNPAVLSG